MSFYDELEGFAMVGCDTPSFNINADDPDTYEYGDDVEDEQELDFG